MGKDILINQRVLYYSIMLLVLLISGIYSCTSLSTNDKVVRYYTFRELGELENLEVLEQQLCTLEAGTAVYCKKLIQYKINKSFQTYTKDTTLLEEIDTEVEKQTDATAYAPVVMYLKGLGTCKSNAVLAYQIGMKAKGLFETHQDTVGLIRLNILFLSINFGFSTSEYMGSSLEVNKLNNQTNELLRMSSYPIDRLIFLSDSLYKLEESYSDALLVQKVDSVLVEAQDFVNKNPNVEFALSNLYADAFVITKGIDKKFIKTDYALIAIHLKVNAYKYISYNNYAYRFVSPNIPDSFIKYTQLSMIHNNGKDLLFLAKQYKRLVPEYENMVNYPMALRYLHKHDSLSQIINANIRQKGILEVQSKYDFDKVQIKQEELMKEKRSGIIFIIFILLILVLVLVSSLLVYMKKLNNRQNSWIKIKENIISVISHDLRSPLTAMTGTSNLMSDAIGKDDMEAVKKNYTSFNNTLSNMYGFTHNLLDWLTDKDGQKIKEPFKDIIQQLQQSTLSYGQFKNIHVSFCDAIFDQAYDEVYVAKGVEVIIRNLVTNIINHSNAHNIEVSFEKRGQHLNISIVDDASPMDDDTYDFVMARLQSTEREDRYMSQGFGLTLVRRFMVITNTEVEIMRTEAGNIYLVRAELV